MQWLMTVRVTLDFDQKNLDNMQQYYFAHVQKNVYTDEKDFNLSKLVRNTTQTVKSW